MALYVERYHDISMAHRIYQHEGKCKHLHGHNYRFWFKIANQRCERSNRTNEIGMVIEFSTIKQTLCEWLEENWDHKCLLWQDDPIQRILNSQLTTITGDLRNSISELGIVSVPFNPTVENIAKHFAENIAPKLLEGTFTELVELKIEETRKCSVIYSKY